MGVELPPLRAKQVMRECKTVSIWSSFVLSLGGSGVSDSVVVLLSNSGLCSDLLTTPSNNYFISEHRSTARRHVSGLFFFFLNSEISPCFTFLSYAPFTLNNGLKPFSSPFRADFPLSFYTDNLRDPPIFFVTSRSSSTLNRLVF